MDTSKFLSVGDVVVLTNGMTVSGEIPAKFAYSDSKLSNKLVNNLIEVGKLYETENGDVLKYKQELAKAIAEKFDSYLGYHLKLNDALSYVESVVEGKLIDDSFILESGEFVVVKTAMEGGSTGRDAYPDGHRVYCKRLNADGTYNPDGTEVKFYQSGCFHGTISPDDISPIRTMRMILTNPTFV